MVIVAVVVVVVVIIIVLAVVVLVVRVAVMIMLTEVIVVVVNFRQTIRDSNPSTLFQAASRGPRLARGSAALLWQQYHVPT